MGCHGRDIRSEHAAIFGMHGPLDRQGPRFFCLETQGRPYRLSPPSWKSHWCQHRYNSPRGIDFDSEDLCIMCLPHVLNICSKHATDDLTSADFSSILESSFKFSNSSINKCMYVEALRKDPIVHARDMVCIVHSSSLCCESFKTLIVGGNNREYLSRP